MSGTFISYREDDAKPWALLLRDELVDAFGEGSVFLDKDGLRAGSWREQIEEALDRCGVVLVVIGRRWLSAAETDGVRRLDRPDDVHRQEVATALARNDVTVIPVLVDGASMPRSDELPDVIRGLTERQARSLSDRSSHRELDLSLLISDIERATGEIATPRSTRSKRVPWPLAAAGLMLIAASVYIGLEIDYRHWTWIVFLVLVPLVVASLFAVRMRRAVWRAR